MNYLFFIFQKFTKYFLALFLFLILFVIFYNSNVEAACPTGNGDGQTINILSDDNCTSRISNPGTSVTVAGNLTVNSGDGAIYYNFNNHTVNITGTVTNTNAGTSHGIHDVTGSTSYTQNVTISGNGSVDGTAAGYYNQGSTVNLTNNQSDLTFKGLVPSSYKILIEGTSDFGKTTFVSPTGTLTFDIASASSISSTGTYSAVLDRPSLARRIARHARSWPGIFATAVYPHQTSIRISPSVPALGDPNSRYLSP